jgi:hypothetical protein
MKKISRFFIVFLLIVGAIWLAYVPILITYAQSRNEAYLLEINKLNAPASATFNAFIHQIESKTDWHVLIVSGYRDVEKQAMLKKMNPKNAEAGKSKHNFGKAIDICVFRRNVLFTKWLVKSSSKQAWEASQITEIAKAYKLNWGGNFSHYHDPVHFEVN